MGNEWYLHKDDVQYGPYSWEELSNYTREGRVEPHDLIWCNGMAQWEPARSIEGLFDAPQQPNQLDNTVSTADTPTAQHPSGITEQVLGILPALQHKTGVFKSKTYTLVVTDRRLIFAELTGQMMKDAVNEARTSADNEGKGFFGRWKETATSQQRIYDRYHQIMPDAIITENPDNFALENRDINKVRINTGAFYHEQGQKDSDQMYIHTAGGKYKFTFQYDNTSGQAKKLLRQVLGNCVR